MIVRSPRAQQNFTIISNHVIRDHRLSWKARGLLIYVLSQPDHWRTSSAHLASISPEGIHAVRTGLKELEEHGYLRRTRSQQANGTWRHDIIIYDSPVENVGENWLTYPQTDDRFSDVGFPAVLERTEQRSTD
jgi:hypothetical protein